MNCTNCKEERPINFSHRCGARLCYECYPLLKVNYHEVMCNNGRMRHGEMCYKCHQIFWPMPTRPLVSAGQKNRVSIRRRNRRRT